MCYNKHFMFTAKFVDRFNLICHAFFGTYATRIVDILSNTSVEMASMEFSNNNYNNNDNNDYDNILLPNILITGTPCTGKSSLSNRISELTNNKFEHINVGELIRSKHLH